MTRWRIITVGKPALGYARAGAEEYLKRLKPMAAVEVVVVKAEPASGLAARVLKAAGNARIVTLDERGKGRTSREFAGWLQGHRDGARDLAFLIGPSDGHPPEVRAAAAESITLSPCTLQHELALVVLLEQLYRSACIWGGHPYHRD